MGTIQFSDVEELIRLAISEDIGSGDITSLAIFSPDETSRAGIIAKQAGVFCGADMARFVYEMIDPRVSITFLAGDGDMIDDRAHVMNLSGPTISVLAGERIVLNFLQRMSGIATRTAETVSLLKGTGIKLLDTRKTMPGFRIIDKYAVKAGGGENHRMGLYDMVMIKDNHIQAAGSISSAVATVRKRYGSRYQVEVETTNLEEVSEAVSAKADIIMLDNMNAGMLRSAAGIINKRARIEVSGNINENRIREIRDLDIDFISMGSLTHSVTAFDLSMEFEA